MEGMSLMSLAYGARRSTAYGAVFMACESPGMRGVSSPYECSRCGLWPPLLPGMLASTCAALSMSDIAGWGKAVHGQYNVCATLSVSFVPLSMRKEMRKSVRFR
jgi:hypothetical protein